MTKARTPREKFKKQHDNTTTTPNASITHRSRTELGRLVGITTTNDDSKRSLTYPCSTRYELKYTMTSQNAVFPLQCYLFISLVQL